MDDQPDQTAEGMDLLPQAQTVDDRPVPLNVGVLDILEQRISVADHFQQTATRRMVLGVHLKVLGQFVDLFGQNGNLDFR